MPDDLRAAVERLREHRRVTAAMEHPRNSPYTYVEVSTGAAGFVPEAELKDMALVVTAYLADAGWRDISTAPRDGSPDLPGGRPAFRQGEEGAAVWKKGTPQVPGWYWFRAGPGQKPSVVEVAYHERFGRCYRPVEHHGGRLFAHLPAYGEWQGPLAPDGGTGGEDTHG